MAQGIKDIPFDFDTTPAEHSISEFSKKIVKLFDSSSIDPLSTLEFDISKVEKYIEQLKADLQRQTIEIPIDTSVEQGEIQKLIDDYNRKINKLYESDDYEKNIEQIRELENEVKMLNEELIEVQNTRSTILKGAEAEEYINAELKDQEHILQALKTKYDELSEAEKKEEKVVRSNAVAHEHHGRSLLSSFSNILRYAIGIRSLYTVFSRLRSAAKTGLGYAANYSDVLRLSLNNLTNAFTMMKAGVGAAISPLANAIAPIVARLAVLFTQAANAVARFFAILTGRSSVIQAKLNLGAYSKAASGAGKATEDAAKDIKNSLAPFDDLNVLVQDTADNLDDIGDGTGGIGEMGSDMFTTLDLETYDSEFLKKLKEWIDSLDLEPLMKAWEKFTDALERFFNLLKDVGMWVLENVLFPLGTWLIESALPLILEILADSLEVICDILEALSPMLQWLWDNILQPLFQFLGDVAIKALQDLKQGLEDIHEWFQDHEGLPEATVVALGFVLLAVLAAAAWKIVTNGLFDTKTAAEETTGPLGSVGGGFINLFNILGQAAVIASIAFLLQELAAVIESLTGLIQTMNDTNTSAIDIFWLLIAVLVPLGLAIAAMVAFIPVGAALKLIAIGAALDLIAIAIEKILGAITDLIDRPLRTLIDFIDKIKEDGPNVIKTVKDLNDAVNDLKKVVKEMAKEVVNSIKDMVKSIEDNATKFEKAFKKMVDAVSDAASAIASTPITPVIDTSSIDEGIAKLNEFLSLLASAGSASTSIGSFSFSGGSIPGLAHGNVIPPNKPFLAMLGDQKSGTNIEAPLDTIVQAMEEALMSSNYSSSQELVLNIDGETFARLTVPHNMKELNRVGYNVKILEGK